PKNGKRISLLMPYTRLVADADGSWQIRHIFYDSKNTVWITTLGGGTYTVNANEIDLDNPASLKLIPVLHDEKDVSTISSDVVFTIAEDAEGNIWAGAVNGLNCFNRSSKKWIHYTNIPGDEHSIHGNEVRSFVFDKKGNLWVGTNGGGLNRYNKSENNFTHFTMVNGLPNDAVYSILCDNSGMLWLGTNRGLCRFNPENYSCTNFTLKDGIQNYEFNTGAAIKLKNGTLLFGGVDGYNSIHPGKIEINKAPAPKVVVSSIKVFDREVPPGDGSVKLNHMENSLTFQFAALSFYRNQDNKYAYKLEPLNTEWIFCNDRRFVTYSNLEPGDYIFKVKASNSDGVWNETGAQLNISITPPWWKTWWFRAGFLLFAILTVIWLTRCRTASLRKQKLILERTVNQRTADLRTQKEIAEQQRMRAEQSEKFKQQFLANMSHEIRTPMNAVMGMTNLLIDKNKNNENFKYLDGIQKSSDTLLHIINDILDFSKIEAGKIELEQIDFSIRDVVEQVKVTLHHKAEEKGLHLITEIDNKIPDVLIGDPVRLNQVLMNLAGNAIKFTEKGSVMISVQSYTPQSPKGEEPARSGSPFRESEGSGGNEQSSIFNLQFSITDTGIGIPKDKLQTVFESF
ncbi:MAG: histidine kinase dimerization/phospho-acceptor domain-containing protein, partial [Bacteroidota bacterium]